MVFVPRASVRLHHWVNRAHSATLVSRLFSTDEIVVCVASFLSDCSPPISVNSLTLSNKNQATKFASCASSFGQNYKAVP